MNLTAGLQRGDAVQRIFRLVMVIWVGSLLTIGYIAAPVLFSALSHVEAGKVAATLFHIEALIGIASGVILILLANGLVRRGINEYRALRWLIVCMLVCVLVGYFALQPFMEALRAAAFELGTDVSRSRYAAQFSLLHGTSSVLYVFESLLGLVLVWKLPPAASGRLW